ncbi:SDR family NAD(P)-dependent oxidoreductase [Microlunatus soli]|uniref:NAD(P)-dependent dehydrogenase, short-chain alcohol dehydrogenase family n=1 Tax=Microlunatus soli TaxID=630515 RepID=A0A1H1YQ06_9ACTN|nr:SDR family oxidoreductase [Microlunatus soli]SDT23565.1 NAD(P)-dependent dehydrogenase, short-chain alcohol dehydrogenase family [Microlunatus soli]
MGALDGKVALVTGGNSGIGLAIARRFIHEGALTYITGRRQDALDTAVAELGGMAIGIRGDVSRLDDLDQLFSKINNDGHRLDVLVANAGLGTVGRIEDITPEDFDLTFDVNVRGTVFTVQKALPLLSEDARIIVVSSTSTSRGVTFGFGAYSASKAALRQFARTWASELAPKIRVNVLTPGPTGTPGLDGVAGAIGGTASTAEMFTSAVPLQRVGDPAEIANGALFLASNESSFMTGSELYVDGGEAQMLL